MCSAIILLLDSFCLIYLLPRCFLSLFLESVEQYNNSITIEDKKGTINIPFIFSSQFIQPILDIFHMLGRKSFQSSEQCESKIDFLYNTLRQTADKGFKIASKRFNRSACHGKDNNSCQIMQLYGFLLTFTAMRVPSERRTGSRGLRTMPSQRLPGRGGRPSSAGMRVGKGMG